MSSSVPRGHPLGRDPHNCGELLGPPHHVRVRAVGSTAHPLSLLKNAGWANYVSLSAGTTALAGCNTKLEAEALRPLPPILGRGLLLYVCFPIIIWYMVLSSYTTCIFNHRTLSRITHSVPFYKPHDVRLRPSPRPALTMVPFESFQTIKPTRSCLTNSRLRYGI